MKLGKRILSIALVVITLISIVSISAEAVSVNVVDKNYGYMVPVNNKGTDVISKVKLYGDYDYMNFFIHSSSKTETYFFYEIFSDEKMTKGVESGYTVCEKGDYDWSPKITLKGKYKTKTYYVVTYAAKVSGDGEKITVDKNSMCQFEMSVDRSPSYDEKNVMLKSVSNTADGPEITWSKISGTSKYYIYRRSIKGTKMTKVGSVSGKKSSFVDTSVKSKDGNYIYTVKGVNKKGTASRYHYSGLICLYAETPVISSVALVENNAIQIKWKKTHDDAIYHIYRKEVGGSWEKLATDCPVNTFNDITAENGKEYIYRVRAVIETSYGTATSEYNVAEKKAVKFLEAPVMKELEINEASIGISWNSVESATGYTVLRKTIDSDEEWTVLAKVSKDEVSYVDTTASATSCAYVYTVRSEGEGFSGSYSSGKEYLILGEPEFNVNVDAEGVHIKWNKVPGATSYRILEQNEDGSWSIKKKTKKTSYDFKPYGYYGKKITVCAVRGEFEEYKEDVEVVHYFPEITLTIKELENYTDFSWNGTNAANYRVYRKLKGAPDSSYELLYESKACGFSNGSPENDVAYTYQIRGVYGEVEQYNNLISKTHTRYSPEKCIDEFNAYKEIEVRDPWYNEYSYKTEYYCFDVAKTSGYKKASSRVYYWCQHYMGEEHWARTSNTFRVEAEEDIVNPVDPLRFCYVVSDSKGSTPYGANTIYVPDATCKVPEVTLTPTSKGFKISWNAVANAAEYDVSVSFAKKGKDKFTKTIEADGSKTYTVNITDVDYYYNMDVKVSAIHNNGNKSTKFIEEYELLPKPKLIKAAAKNDTIKFIWDGNEYDNYQYAVMRKAPGDSKWTTVSRKAYDSKSYITINGKEYKGFCYTDKNTKKGVKYTYSVRLYNPKTKQYVSYYNTKGISAKR